MRIIYIFVCFHKQLIRRNSVLFYRRAERVLQEYIPHRLGLRLVPGDLAHVSLINPLTFRRTIFKALVRTYFFSVRRKKKRRTSEERHGHPAGEGMYGYLTRATDCAGTNSSLSIIPIPAARRLSVRSDGFAVPLSSLLIFVW